MNLKFIAKPAYLLGYFDVEAGSYEPPNEGQLLVTTKLTLGGAYQPDDTTAAVGRITDLLKRNGFYNAGVEPTTSRARNHAQKCTSTYHVDPGNAAKFDGADGNGDTLRPVENLIHIPASWKRFGGLFGWHQLTRDTPSGMEWTIFEPGIPSTIACWLK